MASGSRRACVTGATGFVGWRIAEMLRDRGGAVRAIVRPGTRKRVPDGIDAVGVAIVPEPGSGRRDADRLVRALDGCDVVIHAAGAIRAPTEAAFNRVNVDGTRALVEAANAAGARLVLISSLAAGGPGTAAQPCREDAEPRPVNPYGRSKLAGEEVVRNEARVPWTIIRPPAVYGPRDRGFLPVFRMAARGLFLHPVAPSMPFTFVYIDDLASGVRMAATDRRAIGQTLFIAHPEVFTADDLLRQLGRVYQKPYRPWKVPSVVLRAAAWWGDRSWLVGVKPLLDSGRLREFQADGFVCAVDRARDVLGFEAAVPLAEGLKRTADWYEAQRWVHSR